MATGSEFWRIKEQVRLGKHHATGWMFDDIPATPRGGQPIPIPNTKEEMLAVRPLLQQGLIREIEEYIRNIPANYSGPIRFPTSQLAARFGFSRVTVQAAALVRLMLSGKKAALTRGGPRPTPSNVNRLIEMAFNRAGKGNRIVAGGDLRTQIAMPESMHGAGLIVGPEKIKESVTMLNNMRGYLGFKKVRVHFSKGTDVPSHLFQKMINHKNPNAKPFRRMVH